MATSYTSLLGFALPVTGELDGTWGSVVNNSITQLVEDSVAGAATASVASGDWTLTTTGSGAANQARCAILIPTGSPGVSRNIIAPSQSKAYVVVNQSNAAVVVKGAATTGATVNSGQAAVVAWNGSDFVNVSSGDVDGPASSTDNAIARFDGTTGKIIQNSAVTIADTTGDIAGAGSITSTSASGILTRAAATQDGVIMAGRAGGTSSYAVTLTPNTLSANRTLTLPDASGTVLQSGTAVTVAQGGTGLTSGTSGGIPFFSSTSAMTSSGVLAANALVIGGGAGVAPSTTTTGANVLTALGIAVGSSGAFTTNNAANTFTAAQTFRAANAVRSEAASTQDAVVLAGRAGGTGSFAVTLTPTTLAANRTLTLPDASGTILQSGTAVTVAQGGTGLTSGTSGGIPYYSSTSAITSSGVLSANQFVFGGGAGASPTSSATVSFAASFTGANTFYNSTGQTFGTGTSTQDGFVIGGRAGGSTSLRLTLTPGTLTASRTVTFPDPGADYTVGFRNVPLSGSAKTTSYTLATTDVGEYVEVGSGGSITIPDATFAAGDVVSIFNNTSGNITITCSITTAYISGTDTDKASVTLATRGVCTILFISSTVCVISGSVS